MLEEEVCLKFDYKQPNFYFVFKFYKGTDVSASGTWNFIHKPNADVGLTGQYGRHFGPGGGRPNYGVMLGGKIRF